jgi:hypothetical protein
MNFDFTDDQQAIKRTANELLGARFKPERVRELAEAGSYDDDAWKEMSELGWAGIFIDEEHGGQGLGIVELAILTEELGYALAPVPFLSNAAAGLALQFAGTDEQKQRWLPGIASGEARGAVGMLRDGEARLERIRRLDSRGRGLGRGHRAVRDHGSDAPLRSRARGRWRVARRRLLCGGRPNRHSAVRRDGRRGAEGDGDGCRVRP